MSSANRADHYDKKFEYLDKKIDGQDKKFSDSINTLGHEMKEKFSDSINTLRHEMKETILEGNNNLQTKIHELHTKLQDSMTGFLFRGAMLVCLLNVIFLLHC